MKNIDWNKLKKFSKNIYKYVMFSFILLFISALITYLIFKNNPQYTTKFVQELGSKIADHGSNTFKEFLDIFFSNLAVCIIGIISGMIPVIFIPLLLCTYNGFITGMIFALVSIRSKNVFLFILLGIVPHGIFEIPAVICAYGIGMYLSMNSTLLLIKNKHYEKYKLQIIQTVVFVIIPLLLVAALIETFITPKLLTLLN